jgi:hypothetical protein
MESDRCINMPHTGGAVASAAEDTQLISKLINIVAAIYAKACGVEYSDISSVSKLANGE